MSASTVGRLARPARPPPPAARPPRRITGPASPALSRDRLRNRVCDNSGMTARLFWVLVALAALCAALAGFLLAAQVDSSRPVLASGTWLPQPRSIADFHLTDSRGRSFTRAALLGHPTLVYFGFTHCPDECPDTLAALAR